MRRSANTNLRRRKIQGFTLLELVAVVATIAILVSLLCAALNHTKGKALRISCVNNLRQLQVAWLNYVDDNNFLLPLNQTAPAPPKSTIVARGSSEGSWVTGNPTRDLSYDNIERGTFFRYQYIDSHDVFRCPMDNSTVLGHPETRRTRSYSMNAFLGGDDAEHNPRVQTKLSDWASPGKENTFVFIEEHEDSFWLPGFLVFPKDDYSATSLTWASTPADRHTQGCNITFADGHVDYWRWYSPKEGRSSPKLASTSRDIGDIRRLQACVPQKRNN
jgi:prepilin-type processing-associated H-X9-DG protein